MGTSSYFFFIILPKETTSVTSCLLGQSPSKEESILKDFAPRGKFCLTELIGIENGGETENGIVAYPEAEGIPIFLDPKVDAINGNSCIVTLYFEIREDIDCVPGYLSNGFVPLKLLRNILVRISKKIVLKFLEKTEL